ncbi:MAG: hypothetical protein ACXW4U_12875, partial [Anaerolineales bacterium]
EELDTDALEKMRSKRLEVRARDLKTAQICLQTAGYRVALKDGTILLDDVSAIDHPDAVAQIMVEAGVPPMRLAVEQQNLEDHFLQLTGDAK